MLGAHGPGCIIISLRIRARRHVRHLRIVLCTVLAQRETATTTADPCGRSLCSLAHRQRNSSLSQLSEADAASAWSKQKVPSAAAVLALDMLPMKGLSRLEAARTPHGSLEAGYVLLKRRTRSCLQPQHHSSSTELKQQLFCQDAISSQFSSLRGQSTVCAAIGNGHSANNSSMTAASPMLMLPMGVLTDSYKASHFLQYPQAKKMVAVRREVQHSKLLQPDSLAIYQSLSS